MIQIIDTIGKVTVKIGDLSGLDFPNPYDDNSKYTITVYLGENKHNAYYDLVYNGQKIGPGGPTILNDVSIPFKVKFNGIDEKIYVKYPIVLPYHPITDGIVIFKDSQDSFTIDFPGPPADVTPGELTHSDDISHDDL